MKKKLSKTVNNSLNPQSKDGNIPDSLWVTLKALYQVRFIYGGRRLYQYNEDDFFIKLIHC